MQENMIKELLLFMVNFEKVYDLINWKYLDAVMGKMNFPVLWRKWIMKCIIFYMFAFFL